MSGVPLRVFENMGWHCFTSLVDDPLDPTQQHFSISAHRGARRVEDFVPERQPKNPRWREMDKITQLFHTLMNR
jgi:hypothetical protein